MENHFQQQTAEMKLMRQQRRSVGTITSEPSNSSLQEYYVALVLLWKVFILKRRSQFVLLFEFVISLAFRLVIIGIRKTQEAPFNPRRDVSICIQEVIDRATINTQVDKPVVEPRLFFQEIAYPCYTYDKVESICKKKVADHITKWLKDYLEPSHAKGFVVGVSGGIDSALVSTLCARTGTPTLVIEMPIHQSSSEVQRSQAHISWLKSKFPNVTGGTVDLTEPFETFKKTVNANEINETNAYSEVAFANMRSRLRMVNLYYYASLKGYLVAGTGNKVEDFGVGFFTKYGDGGCGCG
ncbi:hypothetical protein I4U23_031068 [Adineta vaga]|nr:hypothetical protein I4U23_031068 [Adineta vaga]